MKYAADSDAGLEEFNKIAENRRQQFIEAMDDDLNTADAVSAVFELVRDINKIIASQAASKGVLTAAAAVFDELTDVLGIVYNRKKDTLTDNIEALIEARAKARKEKNWAEADRIRDEIKNMGIVLEDTPQGVKWHKV